MTREILKQMLEEVAADSAGDDTYTPGRDDRLSMLVAMDGAMLTVGQIKRLQLRQDFLVARCDRDEAVMLEYARVLGLKLKRVAGSSAGFHAG